MSDLSVESVPPASPGRSMPVDRPSWKRRAQSMIGAVAELLGVMEEVDVAASSQRVGKRDGAVTNAVAYEDGAAKGVGLVQIPLAIDRGLGIGAGVEHGRGRDYFEDGAGGSAIWTERSSSGRAGSFSQWARCG